MTSRLRQHRQLPVVQHVRFMSLKLCKKTVVVWLQTYCGSCNYLPISLRVISLTELAVGNMIFPVQVRYCRAACQILKRCEYLTPHLHDIATPSDHTAWHLTALLIVRYIFSYFIFYSTRTSWHLEVQIVDNNYVIMFPIACGQSVARSIGDVINICVYRRVWTTWYIF